MERKFSEVFGSILKIAPEPLKTKLTQNSAFWAPEVVWFNLSRYVNNYVPKDSKNPTSVAVYAILCDCSETEMVSRFTADGF